MRVKNKPKKPKTITEKVILILGIPIIVIGSYILLLPFYYYYSYEPQEGDLIFQSLPKSPLVETIEGCSRSPLSHCGILVKKGDKWVVLESIGMVKETPLLRWIQQGRMGKITVYRLKKEYQKNIPDFIKAAYTYKGLPYDIQYEMDDDKIYCSELIYKGFKGATGIELAKPQKLRELNWKPYRETIKYFDKDGRVPLEREMVTPVALTRSTCVEKVY